MNNNPNFLSKLSSRSILLVMFLLTGLPLSLAWLMVVADWHPKNITAKGQFLTTPIAWETITDIDFVGTPNTWRLLIFADDCEQTCQTRLESYRKMHIALGRKSSDLSRILITSAMFESNDPFLYQLSTTDLSLTKRPELANKVWLADPQGWVVMSFAADQPAAELHQDILKLLKANTRS